MTSADKTIPRLDYSKPPPGYEVQGDWFNDGESPDAAGVGGHLPAEYWQQWQWVNESEGACGNWFREADGAVEAATRDAWDDHKAQHDPPGLALRHGPHGLGFIALGNDSPVYGAYDWTEQARAGAWAWHDRRLAMADKVELGNHLDSDTLRRVRGAILSAPASQPVWPRCLTWLDEKVDEVERYLADPTHMLPDVLAGGRP